MTVPEYEAGVSSAKSLFSMYIHIPIMNDITPQT